MPTTSRWLALAVLCAGMLMVILDGNIVTVALPAIQADLGFTPAGLTWTMNAYMISFAGFLLFAGRIGDLVGRRRVFVAGLALFAAASLLCGLATGQGLLIAARFLQGIGAAGVSGVSLGMIVLLFPEPRDRGIAIGAFTFVGAAGASIGQVVGGVLTDALSWHWIFFINVPIGTAALALALRVLASERGIGLRSGADAPGAVLVTAGLMTAVYTIVETDRYGWLSLHTAGFAALSAVLLAGFVLRQATAARPLLPLRVFRSRAVSGANVVQILTVFAMFGFQVLVTLYLEQVRRWDAGTTGLALLPAAVMIAAVSLALSARLNARFGEWRMLLTGVGMLTAGIGLLIRLPVHAGYVPHLLPTMILGGGFGLAASALTALGMSGARPDDAGVVSGLFNTTQQLGGALGVAVLTTLAAGRAQSLTAFGIAPAAAATGGFRLAFTVATGALAVALLIAAVVLRPTTRRRPTGQVLAPVQAG